MNPAALSLGELAERLGGRVVGDADVLITGLGALGGAEPGQITHLSNPAYRRRLPTTRASAVILREKELPLCPTHALVVADPYLAFARASRLWQRPYALNNGVHGGASIDSEASIHPTARVGPGAVVGPGAEIGEQVRIHANAVIGARCQLGRAAVIMANAVLYDGVRVGANSVIHAAAVIGADGFGFAREESGALAPIAQLGGVVIGRDVSIGAASTIDRGTIEDTIIEDGVKIDNQVQIGHNCVIGAHSVICGCVGIVGSTEIGRGCVLAGMVGVGGDQPVKICDGVTISARTHVSSSISKPGVYSGSIIHNANRAWKRNALRFQKLDQLARRVARLEKQARQSEAATTGSCRA